MKQFLSCTQRNELLKEHRLEKDKHFADRIKAILLLDSGWSYEMVARALFLDDSTVRRYEKNYSDGGIESLLTDGYKGSYSRLSVEEEEELKKYLSETIYISSKAIMDYIKKEYEVSYSVGGVLHLLERLGFVYKKPKQVPGKPDAEKQKEFVERYQELLENKAENDPICFIDGTHPHHNAIPAYGWILKGEDKELKTNTGRERININGAINTETMDVQIVVSESINADSTIELLQRLEAKYPEARNIYVIADNARYYRAKKVKDYLETSRIKILFLPVYSPNLNLIERFWKFFKKKVLYNKYYDTYDKFQQACLDFFERVIEFENELRSLLTNKFHIVGC